MRFASNFVAFFYFNIEPVRQLISIRVRVINVAALFCDQLASIWAIATGIPAKRLIADHPLKYFSGAAHMFTLGLAIHILIGNPAQSVTGNFMTIF